MLNKKTFLQSYFKVSFTVQIIILQTLILLHFVNIVKSNINNKTISWQCRVECQNFSHYDSNWTNVEKIHHISIVSNKNLLALSTYTGYLDPKFVESINPHWLSFSPPSHKAHYTLGIIHLCIMVVGLFGNALVIFMFLRCRSLRTTANTLVINLAISDFLMLAKAPLIIYNSFHCGPALGDLACRLYGLVGGLTGTLSIATLTAISIDRYLVIVYPLNPLRTKTKLRSRLMVLFVWSYSLIFSIPPALDIGFSKYVPEGYLTSCSFDYLDKSLRGRVFIFIFFIFAWLLPVIIITYCYSCILGAVISAKGIQSNKDKNKTEIRLAAIILYVIGLWFLAWSPYAIVALLGISGNEDKITPLGSMIPALFCKAAACLDPYVYAVTHSRFRMEFSRIFQGRDYPTKYQTSFYTRGVTTRHENGRNDTIQDNADKFTLSPMDMHRGITVKVVDIERYDDDSSSSNEKL